MAEIRITLAAARVNAGMTQEEVASMLKVSNKTIINWEKGKCRPSAATVKILSELYGIPVNYISFSYPKDSLRGDLAVRR